MVRLLPEVLGSFSYILPPSRLMAWFTEISWSPTSDQRSAQISPRRMPVVSASSIARPSGVVSAERARRIMRVRSSRSSTRISRRCSFGGLQKLQGFFVIMSHATACFRACRRSANALPTVRGA